MKIIYADGSSLGNPGNAGFGVVALDTQKNKYWEFGEGYKTATNNQMELAACIFSLKLILQSFEKEEGDFELRLDSKYVLSGVQVWSKNWIKNNWKTADKKPVKNKEYWQQILQLMREIVEKKIKVKWTHVYGHSGEIWNERVDEIAKTFASGQEIDLKRGETIT